MVFETLASQDFLIQSILALAIGGLIGLERERALPGGEIGVRTLALDAWLGFLLALVGQNLQEPLIPVVGLVGVFAFAFAHYYYRARRRAEFGITTTLVIPFTFLLGALMGMGFTFEAGASALIVTFVLAEKSRVHKLAEKISKQEIIDFLILAIAAFIVFPLLPEKPLEFLMVKLNLRFFWSIVILVSVVSFAGYLLVRLLREKAHVPAAFFGGFMSALAVVTWFARDKRATPQGLRLNLEAAMAGSVLSDSVVLAYTSLSLFYAFIGPLLATLLAFGVLTFVHANNTKIHGNMAWAKPLSLLFALEFAAVFLGITLLVDLASKTGLLGLYAGSFIGGLLSLTGALASVAFLHSQGSLPTETAVAVLFLALTANLASKLVIVIVRFPRHWKLAAQPIAVALIAGVLGLAASLLLG